MNIPEIATREWFAWRDAEKAALPCLSEEAIEIAAERMQDRLDKRFMQTDMRSAQYEHESREIADWVEKAMKHLKETQELITWHDCKL